MKIPPIVGDMILHRVENIDGGGRVGSQVLTCGVPGCKGEMVVTINKAPKPAVAILNMARKRGWRIDGDGKKVRECPLHKPDRAVTPEQTAQLVQAFKTWLGLSASVTEDRRAARKAALIRVLADLQISKVTDAKTQQQFKTLMMLSAEEPMPPAPNNDAPMAAASQTLKPLAESLKLPSPAARAQRREVFHMIEESYEDGRYASGVTDSTIAQKLMVSVELVKTIREENFGPAGPDPRIVELRKKIEGLETRVGQIEDAALACVEQAEKKAQELRRDIASLLDQINKLEGNL